MEREMGMFEDQEPAARTAPVQEYDEREYAEECEPELIDGTYEGCGECESCVEQERQRIMGLNESGDMSDEVAAYELERLDG